MASGAGQRSLGKRSYAELCDEGEASSPTRPTIAPLRITASPPSLATNHCAGLEQFVQAAESRLLRPGSTGLVLLQLNAFDSSTMQRLLKAMRPVIFQLLPQGLPFLQVGPIDQRGSDQVGQRAYIAFSALPGPFGLEPGASFEQVWQALHPLVHSMGEQLALWASGQRQAYQASLLSTLHRDADGALRIDPLAGSVERAKDEGVIMANMQGLGYRLGPLQPKQLAALVGLEVYKEGLRSGIQHHTAQAMLGKCEFDAAMEAITEHCAQEASNVSIGVGFAEGDEPSGMASAEGETFKAKNMCTWYNKEQLFQPVIAALEAKGIQCGAGDFREDFFSGPITALSSHMAGFTLHDGHVVKEERVQIGLQLNDQEFTESLVAAIGGIHEKRVHLGVASIAAPLTATSPYSIRLFTRLHIHSAQMARDIPNVHGVPAGNKSNGTTAAQATKYSEAHCEPGNAAAASLGTFGSDGFVMGHEGKSSKDARVGISSKNSAMLAADRRLCSIATDGISMPQRSSTNRPHDETPITMNEDYATGHNKDSIILDRMSVLATNALLAELPAGRFAASTQALVIARLQTFGGLPSADALMPLRKGATIRHQLMPFHLAPYDHQLPPSTVVRIGNKDIVMVLDLLQPYFHSMVDYNVTKKALGYTKPAVADFERGESTELRQDWSGDVIPPPAGGVVVHDVMFKYNSQSGCRTSLLNITAVVAVLKGTGNNDGWQNHKFPDASLEPARAATRVRELQQRTGRRLASIDNINAAIHRVSGVLPPVTSLSCGQNQFVSALYDACRSRGVFTKDGTIVLDLPNLQPGGLAEILHLLEAVLPYKAAKAEMMRAAVWLSGDPDTNCTVVFVHPGNRAIVRLDFRLKQGTKQSKLEHLTEMGNREAGPWFTSFRLTIEADSHAPVACPTNTQRLEAASEAGLDPTKQGYLVRNWDADQLPDRLQRHQQHLPQERRTGAGPPPPVAWQAELAAGDTLYLLRPADLTPCAQLHVKVPLVKRKGCDAVRVRAAVAAVAVHSDTSRPVSQLMCAAGEGGREIDVAVGDHLLSRTLPCMPQGRRWQAGRPFDARHE